MFKKIQNQRLINIFLFICVAQILFVPLLKYNSLNTFYADFGVFLNHTYNVIDEPHRILQGHFQPILYILGFFNIFIPNSLTPYFLLILQSSFIIFCAYLIKKNFSRNSLLVFFLYVPTYTLAFKDFHLDFIFLLTFLIFFIFFYKQKYLEAIIVQNFFFLSKEYFIIYSILCSFFLICFFYKTKNQKLFRYSFLSLVFNLIFFIFIINYLLPLFNNNENLVLNKVDGNYDNIINYLIYFFKNELILKSINLFNDLNYIKFLLICIIPILLVSIKNKKFLIFLIPNFLIILFFDNKNFYNYYSHYCAPLIPLLIYLINKQKNLSKLFFIYLISIHIIFGVSSFSRLFWSKKVDDLSIYNYVNNPVSKNIKKKIKDIIPEDKSIIVITQNNINWHTLADRKSYKVFPEGVNENEDEIKYIVIDTGLAPFLSDQGCNFINDECEDIELKKKYNNIVRDLNKKYKLIHNSYNLFIFKNNS